MGLFTILGAIVLIGGVTAFTYGAARWILRYRLNKSKQEATRTAGTIAAWVCGIQIVLLVISVAAGLNPVQGTPNPPFVSATVTDTATFGPTNTPSPTATLTPTTPPTAPPTPCQPGAVCYRADWSKGIDSWGASGEWHAYNGYLMNDGSRNAACTFPPTLTLPYSPTSPNYSITVQAQFPNLSSNGVNAYFCIYARLGPTSGYAAGVGGGGTKFINSSAGTSFNPGAPWFVAGSNWHTYRFDVNGPDLKFYIDGGLAVTGQDPSSLNVSGQIGLSDFVDVLYIKSIVVKGL